MLGILLCYGHGCPRDDLLQLGVEEAVVLLRVEGKVGLKELERRQPCVEFSGRGSEGLDCRLDRERR